MFCAKCVRDGLYCGLCPDGCKQRNNALRDRSLILFIHLLSESQTILESALVVVTAGHGARF